MNIKQTKNNELSEEFYELANELKQEWEKSKPKYTDREWINIFPEIVGISRQKIKELTKEREKVVSRIRRKLEIVNKHARSELSRWFWRELVRWEDGPSLVDIDDQLFRFNRIISTASGNNDGRGGFEQKLERALEVPIERIAGELTELKKSGRRYVGLCPFHHEKHPSFFIFPDSNRYWCFSCGKGGNEENTLKV